MDIQNNAIVTDVDTGILDGEITQISNDFSEAYYLDNEQQEELELLVAKAMKLGELYERKKWQTAKAQAVPDNSLSKLKNTITAHYDRINDAMHEEGYDDKSFGQLMALDFVEEVIDEMIEAQSVPEGFVLVSLDVVERCMSHICLAMCHQNNSNSENDVMQMDLEILESELEAQEPAND